MRLIDAIRQFFWTGSGTSEPGPRVADLVRQEKALLEEVLAGAAYELHDEDVGLCRVVTERFTLAFGWYWRERWITAAIRLHHPPKLPFELDFDFEYEARNWLEATGLPAAEPPAGPRSVAQVRDALEIVRRVVVEILSDDRTLRETLFYMEGVLEGYNDRARVPEDLPPDPVIVWTEQRLCESGRRVTISRAGEGR